MLLNKLEYGFTEIRVYSETSINRQFLLTVSPYSMYSNQIIILALLLSGGGAGEAHYCSIDKSHSWPA
jgi:hypothetical protein